jgi:hypothetical protein
VIWGPVLFTFFQSCLKLIFGIVSPFSHPFSIFEFLIALKKARDLYLLEGFKRDSELEENWPKF